ncbi:MULTISPECIES: hypothetical protein [Avibacterium]|uniref:Uncharacterized protein n=1 Tax=Avibacterium endocarditidis TaxID=380674 RepID=A0ABX4ZS34_9PAST|nr:hypothetical protein [Avibacterium endocarditidis]POY41809.1 hypothetical protein C3Z13_09750 [Avibacterium endocarditidis]
MSDYISRAEFERFTRYNEERYLSLFNRVLGLDLVLRGIVLPLSTQQSSEKVIQDIVWLLDDVKTQMITSDSIAPEHQKDIFASTNEMIKMLQDRLHKMEKQGNENKL